MKLYHGTTGAVAARALIQGLRSRSMTGKPSNWTHTVESNTDHVYLTNAYALYFALNATDEPGNVLGIVEVETDLLDERHMLPDEDVLEQSTRGFDRDNAPDWWYLIGLSEAGDDMIKRTQCFRDFLHLFQDMWQKSIDAMGTAGYRFMVPSRAITRVALLDTARMRKGLGGRALIVSALDPTISLMNYLVVGAKYRALTQLVFDADGVTPEMLTAPFPVQDIQREVLQAMIAMRDGIRVIDGPGALSCAMPEMMPFERVDG